MPSTTSSSFVSIYALAEPDGEIRYIGKSQDPSKRLKEHIYEANGGGKSYRSKWIRKLLAEKIAPEIIVLESTTTEEWKDRERAWIAFAKEEGLRLVNGTDGGDGIDGYHHTDECKQVMSAAKKNKKQSPEHVNASAEAHRGLKRSAETKQRMSDAAKGKPKSAEHRASISRVQTGKKQSPEAVAKRAESNRGKKRSAKFCEEMHQLNLGRKATPEARANISAGKLGQIPWNKGIPMAEEVKQKVSDSTKGRVPWNKGLKTGPLSDEQKAHMNEARSTTRIEKPLSDEARHKLSDAAHKRWSKARGL